VTAMPIRPSYRALLPLSAIMLVILGACGGGSGPEPPAPPENPMLPLAANAQLYYDDRGGITDSVRTVVLDDEGWAEEWEQATARRAEPPPRPEVDFERYMVLIAAAGRMDPGDRIQVDSAGVRTERTTEDEEEVFEVIIRTVRGCGTLRADIHPLTIVRLPRFDGRVGFVERSEAATCSEDR
jgi:hypothetical protein